MRSNKEIVERVRLKSPEDMFGTIIDLIEFLPQKEAREFMKEDADDADFFQEYTKENVIKQIIDYLPFAYDKAESARGISASRSLMHFDHWLWLLEDDELLTFLENQENYAMYGFPVLQKIAEKYAPEMVKKYTNIDDRTGTPVYGESAAAEITRFEKGKWRGAGE